MIVWEVASDRWRKKYDGMSYDQRRQIKEFPKENERLRKAVTRSNARQSDPVEGMPGNRTSVLAKPLSLSSRRACIDHLRSVLCPKISERRICRTLGQQRSRRRRRPRSRDDEGQLTRDIVELPRRYDRYRYRRIAALLRS